MRLADLLLSKAEDGGGRSLGQVHDARLRHSLTPDGRHRLQVVGVMVGSGSVSARLGYAYGEVRGPWLLVRVMRWFGRHSRYVPWSDAEWDVAERSIRVGRGVDELVHPSEVHGDG